MMIYDGSAAAKTFLRKMVSALRKLAPSNFWIIYWRIAHHFSWGKITMK